ncbi:hypothetical protein [Paenibacillus roseipurpureus]|uniref:Uncharacterized protein n=1 Tax=Paenibacillus roseopurpureus TaxID=2918901 RepID=A0AA96RIF4_9BACL|nr:hypothetical protein [Paenibacillus sp. MBLB1832]WNR42184.1 hypothetical protein MJB10_13655 [Paenibacillus sp. MBLB1832]
MANKAVSVNPIEHVERDVMPLVKLMTFSAWALLAIGLVLSLASIESFSDRNTSLMVGIGFMVGSVFIYVIRTAIHLVHSRNASKIE